MTVAELNQRLGQELGYVSGDDPIFKFEWSEDLFWPLYKTGRMITQAIKHEVPVIGGSTEIFVEERLVPEYRKDRMTHKYFRQWLVTAWIPPESLSDWQARFPGTDYPYQGYRIHTNYVIPEGDIPNEDDVRRFVAGVKYNRQFSETGLATVLKNDFEKLNPLPVNNPEEYNVNGEMGALIADNFNAFMNPTPGKRGGFVSTQAGVGESPALREEGSHGS